MRAGVRQAGVADVDAASAVLADAFADYPWTQWTVESHRHAERVKGLQRLSMDRIALPYGEVWVACDDGDNVMSVAVWMLPDSAVPASVLNEVGAAQATLEGTRHEASVKAEACVAALRPTTPHYYLGAVGTRPDHQREGLGTAVLTPILDRADRENEPVFLETSTAENGRFYAGLGFVTISETDIPDGGPHVWAMMRDRRSTRHNRRLASRNRYPCAGVTCKSGKVSNEELISAAEAALNPHVVGDRLFGDVASTLVTDSGTQYSGVCIDTGSGTGFCAEHSAIAAMVTAGEYRIAQIVAVWRDNEGILHVVPPCGRCREFIRQIDPANLDTEVVLGPESSAKLRELLPFHG